MNPCITMQFLLLSKKEEQKVKKENVENEFPELKKVQFEQVKLCCCFAWDTIWEDVWSPCYPHQFKKMQRIWYTSKVTEHILYSIFIWESQDRMFRRQVGKGLYFCSTTTTKCLIAVLDTRQIFKSDQCWHAKVFGEQLYTANEGHLQPMCQGVWK